MNSSCFCVDRITSILGLISGGLIGVTALAGGMLANDLVFADTDDVSVIVPISCTMSGTGNNSHNAEINNGRYVSEIGTTTLKVICNDSAGFSIYAVGFTGNEIGATNSTKLVGSNNGGLISTGTATSGSTSNWAMKLTTSGTATYPITLQNGFGAYSAVPASYTKVATRLQGTDNGDNATGSTLTTTYAAYINATQTTDTYIGQVKYTLVHPASETPAQPQPSTAGCINYHANASNAVGSMGCQSATDNASVTLLASNFSRTGYGFAGWSDKYDYATNSSAHFYGPQETITAPVGTTANGLSLYAVWVKSEGRLQDAGKVAALCGTNGTGGSLITAPTNGTANLSSVSALTDQRDNQTYAIAKLADGNCWMIENLRLESTNSDNSTGALAQGYGTSATYGNFSGLANPESTNFSNTTNANSIYYIGTQSGDATIDIGNTNYPGYRMPRYNNTNTSARASSPTNNGSSMYSYGNYYTWHAAIADLTYNGADNSSVANTSLCPSGWHLPKGGNNQNTANNEFLTFSEALIGAKPGNYDSSTFPYYTGTPEGIDASNKLRAYPNNFLYSGYFNTSSANYRGSRGDYWSSTASSVSSSYYLYLYSSGVYPGSYSNPKYFAFSIRCTVSAGT